MGLNGTEVKEGSRISALVVATMALPGVGGPPSANRKLLQLPRNKLSRYRSTEHSPGISLFVGRTKPNQTNLTQTNPN